MSKQCITSEISIIPGVPGDEDANPLVPDMATIETTRPTFQINNAELYVPVVTLCINYNIKC